MTFSLSPKAKEHLTHIAKYTLERHGPAQAESYISSLLSTFERLGENPQLGRRRSDINSDYRSFPLKHHIIFYRTKLSDIEILAVLHQSRDVDRFFD